MRLWGRDRRALRQIERQPSGDNEFREGALVWNECGIAAEGATYGQVTLYAYGPDADALYTAMERGLRDLPFRPAHVILRYGSASDPSASEHRVDL